MNLGVLDDIHNKYLPTDAWIYDRYIAPAVGAWFDPMREEIASFLTPEARLLDVGCGGGHLLEHLARRHPDASYTGLDQSPGQVARARKRLGDSAEILQGDALAQPFADATFDIVVSVASIKHWPDARKGLFECLRVLRPGGRLYIVEGDRGVRFEDARHFVSLMRFPRPMHPLVFAVVRTFVLGRCPDLDELRALAADLPLDSLRVERIPDSPALLLAGRRR